VGYTGHVMDQSSGLIYMQQRYYDPQVGRFLSVDPAPVDVTSAANFSRYWYADDNPYVFTDPDGRETGAAYRAIYIADQKRNTRQSSSAATGGKEGSASRYNNPQLGNNVMIGEGIGLGAGITVGVALVAINVVGFPEVEGTELLMAIAGEPIVTPLIVGATSGGGAGAIVGGAAGIVATEPMAPKPTTNSPSSAKPAAPPPPAKPEAPPPPPPPPRKPLRESDPQISK
jgi:RHS repeat-associated protein